MPGDHLLDRETELAQLDAVLTRLTGGDGSVVLVEGPAGIGKTALLAATRERAERGGVSVLSAVASVLDRDFPFGIVHQLLEPRIGTVSPPAGDDVTYAAVHGLYWQLAGLAEEGPVALFVDDLHWADRPSLRVLEYLGRRLEGVGVLVIASVRPSDDELLAALAAGPSATVVRPRPLGSEAVAAVVAAALDRRPDDPFRVVLEEATRGNPLLLTALVREAAADGLAGEEAEVPRLREIAATGIAEVVRRQLATLGTDATALARAIAVVGERRRSLDDLVAMAGLDAVAGRRAGRLLAGAQLVTADATAFDHPVLREAVVEDTPPAVRAELHGRAAERLVALGARADEVAVHLLPTPAAGNAATVARLREAAALAAAEGAPEIAVTYLRRAVEEPPDPAVRGAVLLELGELEARVGDPAAADRLGAALREGLEGDEAARARAARGSILLLASPGPAMEDLEHGLRDARDPALRLRLESLVLESSMFHASLFPRRRELLGAGRAAESPSSVMVAHLAQHAAYTAAPSDEVGALVDRALAGGALVAAAGTANNTYNMLVHSLRYAERSDHARALLDDGIAAARRSGARFGQIYFDHTAAFWHLDFGSIATGIAHAETGLARVREAGFAVTFAAFASILAELLLAEDRLAEAGALLAEVEPAVEETIVGPFVLGSRGALRARERRPAEAEADLRRAYALLELRGWRAPLVRPVGLRLAALLGETGRAGEARGLLDELEAVANEAGTPGMLGATLRTRARLLDPSDAVALLRSAVEAYERSPLLLERGWALHHLGATLRRAGERTASRDPLRAAIEIAERAESEHLARTAREELAASGARPHRTALKGPAALTPSERRTAEMAATGLSNREIAETLWVTRKTVEVHLGHAYAKLGIKSRAQLGDALRPAA